MDGGGAGARGVDPGVVLGYPVSRGMGSALVVGREPRLRSGTVLYDGTRIGDRFETGHNVVVREECELGDDVSVWSGSVVDYGCRIGDRVKIHTGCYVAQFSELGDDAFLAPGVCFANDLYPGSRDSADLMAGPRVGRGAQLGVNVTVLPFVRIGEGAIVGAGSVVTRDLPDHAVAFGNPARVRGSTADLVPVARRVVADEGSVSSYRMAEGSRR